MGIFLAVLFLLQITTLFTCLLPVLIFLYISFSWIFIFSACRCFLFFWSITNAISWSTDNPLTINIWLQCFDKVQTKLRHVLWQKSYHMWHFSRQRYKINIPQYRIIGIRLVAQMVLHKFSPMNKVRQVLFPTALGRISAHRKCRAQLMPVP